jgi:hypothetical protein
VLLSGGAANMSEVLVKTAEFVPASAGVQAHVR